MKISPFVYLFLLCSSVAWAQPTGGLGSGNGACPDPDTLQQILQQAMGNGGGGGLAGILAPGELPPEAANAIQCLLTDNGLDPQTLLGFCAANVTQNMRVGALWDDVAIIAADLWHPDPKILSALPGFDGVIGCDGDIDSSLKCGATFITDAQREELCGPNFTAPSTSAVPFALGNAYNCDSPIDGDDGFPICFSWPVLPSSINNTYLLYKRSDGAEFHPKCISTIPNFEFNERHCIVIFDQFINRNLPGEEGYLYMTELEIVGPIMLVGPNGLYDATGMTFTNPPNQTAYAAGPVFVGARLVPLHRDGEGSPQSFFLLFGGDALFPNDGAVVYASEVLPNDEVYRLRVYYSGGMTPDGLTGLSPAMFDRYFSLNFATGQVLSTSKMRMMIDGTNTTAKVLGLADCGIYLAEGYTPCYADDRDNYIDIILHVMGDATVLETTLTSFTAFSQQPGLYNPGGPGPFPFDTVRYVAPALEQTFSIDVDLGRVREVTYCVHQNGTISTDIATCTSWLANVEMQQYEQGQIFAEQINQLLPMICGNITPPNGTPSDAPTDPSTGGPTDAPASGPNQALSSSSSWSPLLYSSMIVTGILDFASLMLSPIF